MSVYDILLELENTSSRNEKIRILSRNKFSEELRRVVFLALDPYAQFYIRKIPKYTPSSGALFSEELSLEEALDNLNNLATRKFTGNAAISYLSTILSSLSEQNAKVVERIIAKDLKCGVSTATANAVWDNLIPEYNCMLASGFSEKLVQKMKFPAYAQMKSDGMRFNAIVRDGAVEFRSRNGRLIDIKNEEFEQPFIELSKILEVQQVIFDGELLVDSANGLLDRQTGNGILNKAVKGTISVAESNLVRCVIWDYVPMFYFNLGLWETPYYVRFGSLQAAIDSASSKNKKYINCIPTREVKSAEEAENEFKFYYDAGHEGIILKALDSIWEGKRSKKHIKYKGELDADLKIVAVEPGTGKYEGMLGAIICESSDGVIKVRVGSGFNDEQRKTFTESEIVGKIAAVKYNCRSKNKTGAESLFLPIFLEIREDKDEADSSGGIK